ncbi:MAG: hypothetical protein ACE5FT_03765 [Candidatus Nanoarchaeia archaeon]
MVIFDALVQMVLTKTQWKIMQHFVGNITQTFSIRSVGEKLNMDYSLMYRSIKPLIGKYLKENEHGMISLDYRINHQILAYAESLRANTLLEQTKYKTLRLCFDDFFKRFKEEHFVLLLFGSIVNSNKPRDIDVLLIVDDKTKTESTELQLEHIGKNLCINNLHILCISYASVYEMLAKREQKNVINELLNKHIIVHGAELFYRILNKGRQ